MNEGFTSFQDAAAGLAKFHLATAQFGSAVSGVNLNTPTVMPSPTPQLSRVDRYERSCQEKMDLLFTWSSARFWWCHDHPATSATASLLVIVTILIFLTLF